MKLIRIGTVSAINASSGTVDVKFADSVSTGLWLLESAQVATLAAGVSVVCLFPSGAGEGVCLGRHYCKGYPPGGGVTFGQSVTVQGNLKVSGTVLAANFP